MNFLFWKTKKQNKTKKYYAAKEQPENIQNIMTRRIKCPQLILLPTQKTGTVFLIAQLMAVGKSFDSLLCFLPSATRLVIAVTFSCEELVNGGQEMQKSIEIFGSLLLSFLSPDAW